MNIEIQTIRHSDSKLRRSLKEFSDANWGEHVDSNDDILLNFFSPFDVAILAKDEEKYIGLVEIFLKRNAFLGNEQIYIGGIGGVVVAEKYRHRGVATKMLKEAICVLKNEKTDVAMLCTDIESLGKLYKNIGFVNLGRPYFFIDKNGLEKMEKGGMIRVISSEKIYKKVLNSNLKLNVGISNF